MSSSIQYTDSNNTKQSSASSGAGVCGGGATTSISKTPFLIEDILYQNNNCNTNVNNNNLSNSGSNNNNSTSITTNYKINNYNKLSGNIPISKHRDNNIHNQHNGSVGTNSTGHDEDYEKIFKNDR